MSDVNINFPPAAAPTRALTAGEVEDMVIQAKADVEGQVSAVVGQVEGITGQVEGITAKSEEIANKTLGVVSVTQYGAKGDFNTTTNIGTDDTAAIIAAINATPIGGTLRFPGLNFKTTDAIYINKDINVIMEGPICYAGSKNKTALSIVPNATDFYNRKRTYELSVLAVGNPSLTEWADDNFVGIRLENLLYCNITIKNVEKFGIGVLLGARVGGLAWNEIFLGRLRDNRDQLRIQSLNGGWPNANNFYGGSFELSGNFLDNFTGVRRFISFVKGTRDSDGTPYGGNAFFFYGTRFEGGGTITHGSLRVLWFDDLFRNIKFNDARFEYVGINNISKSSIAYVEKSSQKAPNDIKINGYFSYVVPYVQTSDGNPIPLSDCHVVNYGQHSDGNPWQQIFYSNLLDHYQYGVNNGKRYSFNNMYLFSTSNAQFGNTSFNDNADVVDYTNKKLGVQAAIGTPSLKISVKKGDRFKVITDGRYQIAVLDTSGAKMNMPLGTEISATRNGHFVRFGGVYMDYYQSDVVGFNEMEVIVNSDAVGHLVIGASNANSFIDIYRNKENTPNPFPVVDNFYSSAIPSSGKFVAGRKIKNITLSPGGYEGWLCITGGTANQTPWVASTAYTVGQQVNANNKVYEVTVAGTSGTTAPSHTTGTAIDGSATWKYIDTLSVFKGYGLIQA